MRPVVAEAARVLRAGGLVAFPTETVYGLGASARDPEAVRRIFAAKGRPAAHPLIVHLPSAEAIAQWAREVPPPASLLAERFWPGALTLVLRRRASVLDEVTGGQDTVGLRVPSHPLALELLEAFGDGVAAPSANRFGSVSPTTAAHVALELGGEVDLILDGGACGIGVESTIVDLSGPAPRLLRPGGVELEAIEEALGEAVPPAGDPSVRAPGTLPSHYAPRASVVTVAPDELERAVEDERGAGRRVVVLSAREVPGADRVALPAEPRAAAQRLYAALREVDQGGYEVALVVLPEERGLGRAVADRLRRAAAPRGST